MHFLIRVGIEFHFSAALTENADCPEQVFLNLAEQSPLADALVSLVLSVQNDTHCLSGGGASSLINFYIRHINAKKSVPFKNPSNP